MGRKCASGSFPNFTIGIPDQGVTESLCCGRIVELSAHAWGAFVLFGAETAATLTLPDCDRLGRVHH